MGDGAIERRPGRRKAPIRAIKETTLREVAALAGVSPATASHALNGTRAVSQLARDRVRAAATALGYHPNAMARGLKTGSSPLIGCIVGNLSNPLIASAVEGADAVLRSAGYSLLIYRAGRGGDDITRGMELAASYHAAGLLVIHPDVAETAPLRAWEATGRPLILGIHPDPGLAADQVLMAEEEAAYRATRYLIGFGHTRIALLTRSLRIGVYARILNGHRRALAESNIRLDRSLIRTHEHAGRQIGIAELGYREARSALGLDVPPTAMICAHNQIAIGALRMLREQAVSVPSSVSLLSFDQVEWMKATDPTVTSIGIEGAVLGRAAGELLIARLDGSAGPPQTSEVKLELTVRASVGPWSRKDI